MDMEVEKEEHPELQERKERHERESPAGTTSRMSDVQCAFAHDAKDDKNRCYECGATDHYRKDCTRKQQEKTPGNKMDKSPGKIAKVSEVEDEENNRQEGDQEDTSSASTATLKGAPRTPRTGMKETVCSQSWRRLKRC